MGLTQSEHYTRVIGPEGINANQSINQCQAQAQANAEPTWGVARPPTSAHPKSLDLLSWQRACPGTPQL